MYANRWVDRRAVTFLVHEVTLHKGMALIGALRASESLRTEGKGRGREFSTNSKTQQSF